VTSEKRRATASSHLHVLLDIGVVETTTNQSLGVKDGVGGVHGRDVLGRVTDEPLLLGKRDVRGGGSVTLVVGDDLDSVVLPYTDTRVGGTQVDTCCLATTKVKNAQKF
jgi:hypothetical protein